MPAVPFSVFSTSILTVHFRRSLLERHSTRPSLLDHLCLSLPVSTRASLLVSPSSSACWPFIKLPQG